VSARDAKDVEDVGQVGDAEVAGSGAGSRRRPGVGGLVLDSNEETAFTAPPHQR